MRALNVDVPDDLLSHWVDWFAPDPQPFLVDTQLSTLLPRATDEHSMTAEVRDTYGLYDQADGLHRAWLSEDEFVDLPRSTRAALVRAQVTSGRELVASVRGWQHLGRSVRDQADGHRFVWWRSLLVGREERVLRDYVDEGCRPSRHRAVPQRIWDRAAIALPDAERLAGTFPSASGPNCFGTVMAAAGVPNAEEAWMQREPFESWLAAHTKAGADDGQPGTVLVWRSTEGLLQHAAVTIGGGFALHKRSQGWMSPVKVLTVEDCKASARAWGRRLTRHALA